MKKEAVVGRTMVAVGVRIVVMVVVMLVTVVVVGIMVKSGGGSRAVGSGLI